ncbi:MAG: hypothetical protein IPI14_10530 [Polaromonas sp.]|nr:hypothetical protein [Polaromonas sp.]
MIVISIFFKVVLRRMVYGVLHHLTFRQIYQLNIQAIRSLIILATKQNVVSQRLVRQYWGGIGGAIGGAVVFLVIGKALGLGDRAVANLAKAGAVGGGVVGSRISYDNTVDAYRRQCEIYKLSTMRTTKSDFITLVKNNDLLGDISVIPDRGHFFHRSASLTASGKKYYSALAKSYTDDAQLKSYEQVIRNSAGTSKSDQANKLRNYKSSQADDAKLNIYGQTCDWF